MVKTTLRVLRIAATGLAMAMGGADANLGIDSEIGVDAEIQSGLKILSLSMVKFP